MATSNLAGPQNRADFFNRSITNNLKYWDAWLQAHSDNVDAQDKAHEGISRAILFGLELKAAAWPAVCQLIRQFSPFMERRGHWEIWRRVLGRAVAVADEIGDLSGAVNFSVLLARLLFQQSRFRESVAYYRKTIRTARHTGDLRNLARACSNLGYYYAEFGQYSRAEVLCCRALAIFEQLDDSHGLAHTHNHLGVLYQRQNCFAEAKQHLELACDIWQARDDSHGLIRGLINLSILYLDIARQPDKALSYLEKGLQRSQQLGEIIERGTIYLNMGIALRRGGKAAEAETYARRAETIFEQTSNLGGLARVWGTLGNIYRQQRNLDAANLYLEKALQTWRNLNYQKEIVTTLLDMAEYDLVKKDRPRAAARLNEAQQLIASAHNREPYRHLQPQIEKIRRSLGRG